MTTQVTDVVLLMQRAREGKAKEPMQRGRR
jgi:hypothetical protein